MTAQYSLAILLITQLVVAAVIDYGGLFDTAAVKYHFTKLLGLGMMIAGIIVFKPKISKMSVLPTDAKPKEL